MFIQILLIFIIIIQFLKPTIFIFYPKTKNNTPLLNTTTQQDNHSLPHYIRFQFIGNLYNNKKNIMLKLYGRERIRHVWDYFIIYNNHSTETKMDLSSHKNRLEHLDSIYLEIFQTDFILYKNENRYHYYPYIFSH